MKQIKLKQTKFGRKGQMEIPSSINMMLSIGAMVLIFLIIFFLISLLKGCGGGKEVGSVSERNFVLIEELDASEFLVSLLKTDVELGADGEKMKIARLLQLWYYDKGSYEQLVQEKIKSLLDVNTQEFVHPIAGNIQIKAYELVVYDEMPTKGKLPSKILNVQSSEFRSCVSVPCQDYAVVAVPADHNKSIYAVLWISYKAKQG